jgi:DNA helicase-2/ATP-dependent DNA helicase PcrA
MEKQPFKQLWERLNPQQQEAVAAIEGPVMVIAGPGTGKTQILTMRIANILQKTDTTPDAIIALTFTENAAANMRARLATIIGPAAYRVWIGTFHGFCNEILTTYPEYFEELIGRHSASDVERVQVVQEALTRVDVQLLKPFAQPLFHSMAIAQAIAQIKREGVSPANFLRIVHAAKKEYEAIPNRYHQTGRYAGQLKGMYVQEEKNIEKNMQVQKVYEAYQAVLAERGLYDFEDMILEVATALQIHTDLLLTVQERFAYCLVDEHQDTNNAQNKILELLTNFSDEPNIFVVGDEKQAIFRFQGASIENFLYFKKLYPSARLIVLSDNYRSNQAVLDASHAVISGRMNRIEDAGIKIPNGTISGILTAANRDSNIRPVIAVCDSLEAEVLALVETVKKHHAHKIPLDHIAVLCRDNRDTALFAAGLKDAHIQHRIISKSNSLHDKRVRQVLALCQAIVNFPADELMGEILHFDFFGLSPLDIAKIVSYRSPDRPLTIIEKMISADVLSAAGISDERLLAQIGQQMLRWKTMAHNASPMEVFQDIVYESGCMAAVLADSNSIDSLAKITLLSNEIQAICQKNPLLSLAQVCDHFALLKEYNIPLSYTPRATAGGGVVLMTAHAAKGLEFDVVWITQVHDGHWGNRIKKEFLQLPNLIRIHTTRTASGHTDDDERRLLYVAMTRARQYLYASYARYNTSGIEQLPSPFLNEIDPAMVETVEFHEEKKPIDDESKTLQTQTKNPTRIWDIEFIRDRVLTTGLSATAVNNFLECPLKYFYVNLLRIPTAKSRAQIYGTAVHATLKDIIDRYGADKKMTLAQIDEIFAHHLKRSGLAGTDAQTYMQKGTTAVRGYVKQYGAVLSTLACRTEVKIAGAVLPGDAFGESSQQSIPLTGFLDRVDFLDASRVRVVDYKTGKIKTKNEVEGRTKSADGNYLRQLVFYKMLIERSGNGWIMDQGRIDFVEPDEKNRYVQHDITVTADDVDGLYRQLGEMMQSVWSGDFLSQGCKKEDCRFCELSTHLTDRMGTIMPVTTP